MRILLLNGPNLNLLGTRAPEVYGSTTLPELEVQFRGWAAALGVVQVEAFQSNHEGELIDRIHAARGGVDGIVFNPGAYTHTSYSLHDAIEAVGVPTVETHISDIEEREAWRQHSAVRPACVHTIYGRGIDGYRWALRHLIARAARPVERITYGEGAEQFSDLRLPDGDGPFPLAVLVHGGFWRHRWTRDTTELVALDLADRGVATLNVEYRRVGSAGGDGGGTASLDDVVEAVVAGLGHPDVDTSRWAIGGHSAGAQLALIAARTLALDPDTAPHLVVSLAGVLDLAAAVADDLGGGAATAYLAGRDPEALSPTALVPLGVVTLLSHGLADDLVPSSQSEGYLQQARAAGDDVELLTGPHDHFNYLDPAEPAWVEVAERITAALG